MEPIDAVLIFWAIMAVGFIVVLLLARLTSWIRYKRNNSYVNRLSRSATNIVIGQSGFISFKTLNDKYKLFSDIVDDPLLVCRYNELDDKEIYLTKREIKQLRKLLNAKYQKQLRDLV